MKSDSRIYVAGHKGLVGASLVRKLREDGFTNLLLKTRSELDLTKSEDVLNFFKDVYVFPKRDIKNNTITMYLMQ